MHLPYANICNSRAQLDRLATSIIRFPLKSNRRCSFPSASSVMAALFNFAKKNCAVALHNVTCKFIEYQPFCHNCSHTAMLARMNETMKQQTLFLSFALNEKRGIAERFCQLCCKCYLGARFIFNRVHLAIIFRTPLIPEKRVMWNSEQELS